MGSAEDQSGGALAIVVDAEVKPSYVCEAAELVHRLHSHITIRACLPSEEHVISANDVMFANGR